MLCTLQAFCQNSNSEIVQNDAPNFILLKNDMLDSNCSYVPTKVYLKQKKLPFFCDLELKLEAAAKMPIKIRLGEVQQVERLEGKY